MPGTRAENLKVPAHAPRVPRRWNESMAQSERPTHFTFGRSSGQCRAASARCCQLPDRPRERRRERQSGRPARDSWCDGKPLSPLQSHRHRSPAASKLSGEEPKPPSECPKRGRMGRRATGGARHEDIHCFGEVSIRTKPSTTVKNFNATFRSL